MERARPPRSVASGLVVTNVAVLFFGLAGVLGTISMFPAPLITLARVLLATPVLAIVVFSRGLSVRPQGRSHLLILVAQGALLAIHWTAFFQSIVVSSVAIGLLAFSSFPLFAAALEPLLLKQRPTKLQVIAALFIVPGVYLLVPAFSFGNTTTAGVLWGILAGATFALLSVVNRWLGRSYPSLVISLYQDGIATLVLLPVLLFVTPAQPVTLRAALALVMLGVVCTALAHTLFIEGMRGISAQMASLIASLEPVWGILFALLLLHQVPTGRTLVGGGIILGAALAPLVGSILNGEMRTKPS